MLQLNWHVVFSPRTREEVGRSRYEQLPALTIENISLQYVKWFLVSFGGEERKSRMKGVPPTKGA